MQNKSLAKMFSWIKRKRPLVAGFSDSAIPLAVSTHLNCSSIYCRLTKLMFIRLIKPNIYNEFPCCCQQFCALHICFTITVINVNFFITLTWFPPKAIDVCSHYLPLFLSGTHALHLPVRLWMYLSFRTHIQLMVHTHHLFITPSLMFIRDPARKLPATDDWRYRDAAARSQGGHRPWRPPWGLARAPRRSLVTSDGLPLTFWQVSVQTHAVWHQFGLRSISEETARTDRGTTRHRDRGWWFRCRRIRQHGWWSERWLIDCLFGNT